MIKKIILGLLLGISLIPVFLWYSSLVRRSLEKVRSEIEQMADCQCEYQLGALTLLSPSCTLIKVKVTGLNNDWSWSAERLIIRSSWWHLLWYGTVPLAIEIKGLAVNSVIRGAKLAIEPHLRYLIEGKSCIPFDLNTLIIDPMQVTIANREGSQAYSGIFSFTGSFNGPVIRYGMQARQISVMHDKTMYLRQALLALEGVARCAPQTSAGHWAPNGYSKPRFARQATLFCYVDRAA